MIASIIDRSEMPFTADGLILSPLISARMNVGQVLEAKLGWAAYKIGCRLRNLLRAKNSLNEIRDVLTHIYGLKMSSVSETQVQQIALALSNGAKFGCPVFDGPDLNTIGDFLQYAGCNRSGQEILHDGLTGLPFDRPVTVGVMYIMQLHHLVSKKMHARSVGPYSLVSCQPLSGKAQAGGQRIGEMEFWALEGHGVAHVISEALTTKSDDSFGRMST